MAQLHQIVTLRRDSALWKRTSPALAPELVLELRHAPVWGELSGFPKPLLDRGMDQRHADKKRSLLEKAATSQAFPFLFWFRSSAFNISVCHRLNTR